QHGQRRYRFRAANHAGTLSPVGCQKSISLRPIPGLSGWPGRPHNRPAVTRLLFATAAGLALTAAPARAADPPVRFNRDVRPILSENCFFCHGPDKNKRKAGLRLDDRDSAVNKEAIVPGKPD